MKLNDSLPNGNPTTAISTAIVETVEGQNQSENKQNGANVTDMQAVQQATKQCISINEGKFRNT